MANSSIFQLNHDFTIDKEIEKENILSLQKLFLTQYYEPLVKNIANIDKKYNFNDNELTSYIYYQFCKEYFEDFKDYGIPVPEQIDFETSKKVQDVISLIENKIPKYQIQELWANITELTSFLNKNRFESGLIAQESFDLLSKKLFYLPIFEDYFLNPHSFSIFINFQYPNLNKIIDVMLSMKRACLRSLKWSIVNQNHQSLLNYVKQNPVVNKYSIKGSWYISKGLKDSLGNYIFTETLQKPTVEAIRLGFATRVMPKENKPSIVEDSVGKDEVPIFLSGKKVIIKFKDENLALMLKDQTQKKSYNKFNEPSIPNILNFGINKFKKMQNEKTYFEGSDFSTQSLELEREEWRKHLKKQRIILVVFLIIFSVLFYWYGEKGRYRTISDRTDALIDTKTGKIYYGKGLFIEVK